MSADNYYMVRIHPLGGFTFCMGLDSSDETPIARLSDPHYNTVHAAYNAACDEYSEYPVELHEEVWDAAYGL